MEGIYKCDRCMTVFDTVNAKAQHKRDMHGEKEEFENLKKKRKAERNDKKGMLLM